MAELGVELVVVVAVLLLGSSQAIQTEKCPRASPEELWYSDYSPMLQNTCLEEMSYYFRLIYGRLEDGHLFTFVPHIKEDPEKASNLTQRLTLSEKTALARMGRAYDVMENSWLDLGETSRQFLAGDKPASEVVRSMENLQKAHIRANELLVDAGREVAFFFRDMLELAIEGVIQILETEVQEAPDDEYGVAKLIQEKIVKISPLDLVGVIVRRFIGRSMGTVHTSPNKDPPNVLFSVMPRIDQMLDDFMAIRTYQVALTPENWTNFLEKQLEKSLEATKKRERENFVLIYRNEVYVAEVLMNMITSYTE
ncbi:hypothetical protein DAPPUDRAFT_306827 [Daphnia pulex]|uniref:Uncharacterized protein n=1 Tax=Daphnia pulex TaxID=6669 RepID=E9GZ22_DAPPU|nr:hypothetical protein DAPPUDRAFT_306827 [Daphnia pulex]|eukprot:EFX75306.1 hypothetical protein DAPPUDRAFT_306827 [Daphnia pulex]